MCLTGRNHIMDEIKKVK